MKIDNLGILYFNETERGNEIHFPITNTSKKKNKNSFYELKKLKDYIIKYSKKELNQEEYLNMLKIFKDTHVTLSNLPIGYYQEEEKLRGTIIPYYPNSISLLETTKGKNLNGLYKYYHHDDDKLHNLYLLLNDILSILEELQNSSISYFDSNPSNFLIKDNEIKLIDFDPEYLKYNPNKENIKTVLSSFDDLVYYLHLKFKLDNLAIYKAKDFKTMRKHLVKLENKMRKR